MEALARSGVGALTLIDMDDVCITNTNRQLPALAHTIGVTKVDVLAARVAEINPACRVNRAIEFLTESNVDRLLAPSFDFVVDAVDRTSIKALIIAKCHARGLRVITSGSAANVRAASRRAVVSISERTGRSGRAGVGTGVVWAAALRVNRFSRSNKQETRNMAVAVRSDEAEGKIRPADSQLPYPGDCQKLTKSKKLNFTHVQ